MNEAVGTESRAQESDSSRPPYRGRKRGRKPKQPISPLESGFMDSRTRRPRLTSPEAWRRELRFIYRETLEGRIPTAEATRLTYIVNCGCSLEQQAANSEAIRRIEARIAALEGTSPSEYQTPLLTHDGGAGAVIDAEVLPNTEATVPSAEGL